MLSAFGCAKVETYVKDTLKEDFPIDFSWYSTRNVFTKADPDYFVGDVAGSTSAERHLNSNTSMGVFGYFHPQESGSKGTWKTGAGEYNAPNLFYNEPVSITENGGVYTYDYSNSRFWPRNKMDRISFIAYYPWNKLAEGDVISANTIVEPFLDKSSKRQGMVGFYYVVPQNSDDQIDFCVSDLCLEQSKAEWTEDNNRGLTGTATGKVKFFFHHALSQIRVKNVDFDTAGNPDVEVKINYILFRNVAVYGQCIPVPDFAHKDANTGRVPVAPTWPAGSLVAKRPDTSSGVQAEVCFESPSTWKVEEFLLMIPHTFFKDATIEVNFDVLRKKDAVSGEYYSYTGNTLSAPLTTTTVQEWQAGKIYTYSIKLDLKQIKVTADVVDWLDAGDDVVMDKQS